MLPVVTDVMKLDYKIFKNYQFIDSWLQSVDDHLKFLAVSTDTPTAYICENVECSLPITSVKGLKDRRID